MDKTVIFMLLTSLISKSITTEWISGWSLRFRLLWWRPDQINSVIMLNIQRPNHFRPLQKIRRLLRDRNIFIAQFYKLLLKPFILTSWVSRIATQISVISKYRCFSTGPIPSNIRTEIAGILPSYRCSTSMKYFS